MNPQEKEHRAENRDENSREEHRKEKADRPSRLGKEAKIGAAVILVLLAVLAAVVVARLTKSDDKELASAADSDSGIHRPHVAAKDDPLFKDLNSGSFGGRPATVVPAGAASTASPGSIDSKPDKWNPRGDKNDSKRVESRYSSPDLPPRAPPSFATDPPKAPQASRYDPVAAGPLPGLDVDDSGRHGKKLDESHSDPPDVKKRPGRDDSLGSVATRKDFERGDSSGFAAADDPPPPSRRAKHRYEDSSAALMAPLPVRGNSQYGDGAGRQLPATTVSQYDEFPRAPARSDYDRGKPRHYDSPSYGSLSQPRKDGKYEVEPNDSYWKISEKVYGTSAYFKALAELNRGKVGNENRLKPGEFVSTPSIAELEKSYPELCPKAGRRETQENRAMNVGTSQSYRGGRNYTVAEGDTLFNIARYELGKASRWAEIYSLNRDALGKDFNYLTPGMKLVLPDNEKSDVLTRKSSELYR